MSKVKAKKSKETKNYKHLDLTYDMDLIDKESLQTVCLDNGIKLVIGRNTKTDQIQGLKFLLPQVSDDKDSEEE